MHTMGFLLTSSLSEAPGTRLFRLLKGLEQAILREFLEGAVSDSSIEILAVFGVCAPSEPLLCASVLAITASDVRPA